MTHLNIQQGLNIEVVSSNIIKKLYEAALSVPEPLEGEWDAAYMSGNLLVDRTYRTYVLYLTGRFSNLHINVTDSYYIPFEDSAVLSALLANNIGDGVGITESNALAVTNMSLLGLTGNSNITSFTELRKFKNITTGSTDYFAGCTNLEWIALPENNNNIGISYYISGGKTLKWVVPSVEFACSRTFGSWYNNPGRGGGADHVWTLYDLNKQPITDVVIPDGVTTIGKYVFSKMSCDSITIPTSITDIKQCAFENTLIVSPVVLNLPNLTSIEQGAFLNCTAITSITNLGSITSIPNNCFLDCTSLTSLYTGISRVTNFGSLCFRDCTSLAFTTADIANAVNIGEYSFLNCKKLTGSLSLPNLMSIGKRAFENCTGITAVTNLGNIAKLGAVAGGLQWGCFRGCTNLTEFIIPLGLKEFTFSVFGEDSHVSNFIFPYGFEKITGAISNVSSENARYILYPSTIREINCVQMNYFSDLNKLNMSIVVQATNIPTTKYTENGNSFANGNLYGVPGRSKWYVPDAKLNDYKAHADWASFSSSIFPISLLETDSPTCWALYQANKDYGVPTQS